MTTDWRQSTRQRALDVLEARDDRKWTALLVELLAVASSAEIEKWAYHMLRSTSHETQQWWLGACNCHGQLN